MAIQRIHAESRGTYGSPRVLQELKKAGWRIGKKRVERLMRENEIRARAQKVYSSRSGTMRRKYNDIPNHQLNKEVSAKDEVWLGDITYLKVGKQWRYLAVVMDRWSRRVIGWSLGKEKASSLTLAALNNAAKKRAPGVGLVFHSDRGSEYFGASFRDKLKRLGIVQSANRAEAFNDNAHMESFFHSFKSDEYHGRKFHTDEELRKMIESYMPFYNHKRMHSGLGYQSPVEFEETKC